MIVHYDAAFFGVQKLSGVPVIMGIMRGDDLICLSGIEESVPEDKSKADLTLFDPGI